MKTQLTPLEIFKIGIALYDICDNGLSNSVAIHPLWQSDLEDICDTIGFDKKFLPTERIVDLGSNESIYKLEQELELYFKNMLAEAKQAGITPRQLGYRDPEKDAATDEDS